MKFGDRPISRIHVKFSTTSAAHILRRAVMYGVLDWKGTVDKVGTNTSASHSVAYCMEAQGRINLALLPTTRNYQAHNSWRSRKEEVLDSAEKRF